MPVNDALYCNKPNAISLKLIIIMKTLERLKKLIRIFHIEACAII